MKRFLAAAIAATIATSVGVTASPARAQTAERVYDNGTVWVISKVETKPGMFDDYMAYLASTWRAIQEADKKAGYLVSYKVMTVDSPRDHEPDLLLMVEYKNMAAFDRSLAENDKAIATAFGSPVKGNQAAVSRESLRTMRGDMTLRELKFIK